MRSSLSFLLLVLVGCSSSKDATPAQPADDAATSDDVAVNAADDADVDEPSMSFPAGPGTPPPVKPVACTAEFCFVNPIPTGGSLISAWGSAASDVWAVGRDGAVLHFDGKAWSAVDVDVQGAMLVNVFGTRPDDVWMVGDAGRVVRWDGKAFTQPASGIKKTLNGVWGSAPNDVWIVGDGSTILHWNGTAFEKLTAPVTSDFQGIWGRAPNDVWAVGTNGTVVHYDGKLWYGVKTTADVLSPLIGVWGASKNDVYVTGGPGTHHWDGKSWTRVTGGSITVWGTAHDDVHLLTADGAARHFDGKNWSYPSGPKGIGAAWGVRGDAVGVGTAGLLSHWNGTEWASSSAMNEDAMSIAPLSPTDVWITTSAETAMHFDGHAWTVSQSGVLHLSAIASNDIWAVGHGGTFHWDGSTWTKRELGIPDPTAPSGGALSPELVVFARATNDVWFAHGKTIVRWDGTKASTIDAGIADSDWVSSIWAAAANDVWVTAGNVSDNTGVVRHWDGTTWTTLDAAPSNYYKTVHGIGSEVWIAGKNYVLHRTGSTWQHAEASVELDHVLATAAGEVWATAAFDGRAWHWKSGAWTPVLTGSTMWLQSLAGTGSDVWLGGDKGTILRHR